MRKKENPFQNILFNIILPVLILNYGHRVFSKDQAVWTLLIALMFPIGYGALDYIKNKHKNILSILGMIHILLTGGFALLRLDGIWFVVKEATFPLLIGVGCLYTVWTKTPLIKWLIDHSHLLKIKEIESCLQTEDQKNKYIYILKQSTLYFSFCFFFSALLNGLLAFKIFHTQPSDISASDYQVQLNEQIADMTWISYLVIGLPVTIASVWVLYWLIKKLNQLTGLTFQQMLHFDP